MSAPGLVEALAAGHRRADPGAAGRVEAEARPRRRPRPPARRPPPPPPGSTAGGSACPRSGRPSPRPASAPSGAGRRGCGRRWRGSSAPPGPPGRRRRAAAVHVAVGQEGEVGERHHRAALQRADAGLGRAPWRQPSALSTPRASATSERPDATSRRPAPPRSSPRPRRSPPAGWRGRWRRGGTAGSGRAPCPAAPSRRRRPRPPASGSAGVVERRPHGGEAEVDERRVGRGLVAVEADADDVDGPVGQRVHAHRAATRPAPSGSGRRRPASRPPGRRRPPRGGARPGHALERRSAVHVDLHDHERRGRLGLVVAVHLGGRLDRARRRDVDRSMLGRAAPRSARSRSARRGTPPARRPAARAAEPGGEPATTSGSVRGAGGAALAAVTCGGSWARASRANARCASLASALCMLASSMASDSGQDLGRLGPDPLVDRHLGGDDGLQRPGGQLPGHLEALVQQLRRRRPGS